MEDFIYFLFLALWIIIPLIKSQNKKKKKPQPVPPVAKEARSSRGSSPKFPPKTKPKRIQYETIEAQFENRIDNIPKRVFGAAKQEGISILNQKNQKSQKKSNKKKAIQFNLKQAVIHQIIIERPYKN